MNVAEQAKNGLKTFLLTFSISLFIFGGLYYILFDYSSGNSYSIEDDVVIGTTQPVEEQDGSDVNPFKDLIAQKPDTQPAQVLSGHDEDALLDELLADTSTGGNTTTNTTTTTTTTNTTSVSQSTVPDTGVFSITVGFITSLILLGIFSYMVFMNPRNYALRSFEKDISEDF